MDDLKPLEPTLQEQFLIDELFALLPKVRLFNGSSFSEKYR